MTAPPLARSRHPGWQPAPGTPFHALLPRHRLGVPGRRRTELVTHALRWNR
jgi:hypothetical protein